MANTAPQALVLRARIAVSRAGLPRSVSEQAGVRIEAMRKRRKRFATDRLDGLGTPHDQAGCRRS